jgi:hypothetical protein
MKRSLALIAVIAAITGCGAHVNNAAAGEPSTAGSSAASAPSSAPPPPEPSSSPSLCLTHACVAKVLEQSLPGMTAEDGSTIVKVKCKASTVRHNPDGSYTVSCDATYSDQTVWYGLGTYIVSEGKVSWQPQGQAGQ